MLEKPSLPYGFTNHFEIEELYTCEGPCLHVKGREIIEPKELDYHKVEEVICSELRLLSGIGKKREKRLREMGFGTLRELVSYRPFSRRAQDILDLVEEKRIEELLKLAHRFLPKSHPLLLCVSILKGIENLLFMDIETMGMVSKPIILVGIGWIRGEELMWEQYVARTLQEERAVLLNLVSRRKDEAVLVTYNGSCFDLPYIKERLSLHRMDASVGPPHLDLCLFSRRWLKDRLGHLALSRIERKVLGIRRMGDIPSHLVPHLYEAYLRSGDADALLPIMRHNRYDVLGLVCLLLFFCSMLGLLIERRNCGGWI